jgi:hypothetical protein
MNLRPFSALLLVLALVSIPGVARASSVSFTLDVATLEAGVAEAAKPMALSVIAGDFSILVHVVLDSSYTNLGNSEGRTGVLQGAEFASYESGRLNLSLSPGIYKVAMRSESVARGQSYDESLLLVGAPGNENGVELHASGQAARNSNYFGFSAEVAERPAGIELPAVRRPAPEARHDRVEPRR